MRVPVLTAAILAMTLSACGEGSSFDEGLKSSFREKFVSGCVTGAEKSMPAGVNVDLSKICGCTADKVMEGKAATDLVSEGVGTPDQLAKLQQCVTELYPNGLNVKIDAK